jgi:hypothetical protein
MVVNIQWLMQTVCNAKLGGQSSETAVRWGICSLEVMWKRIHAPTDTKWCVPTEAHASFGSVGTLEGSR